MVAGSSRQKSPTVENSKLEMRASPKEIITLEIKTLIVKSLRKLLKLSNLE